MASAITPEQRLNRFLLGGSALEFFILSTLIFRTPKDNREFHMFCDEEGNKSGSFKRLWMFFVFTLGASRLACYHNRCKEVWTLTLALHCAEVAFFYVEALRSKRKIDLAGKGFLVVLLGIPGLLFSVGPSNAS